MRAVNARAGGDRLDSAIGDATAWLKGQQSDDGYWLFDLEADVTIPAEYILLQHFLATQGLLDAGLKIRPMILPDRFIAHGTPEGMYEDAGLKSRDIVSTVLAALGRDAETAKARA